MPTASEARDVQELTRRLRQVDEQASSLSFQRVKERTKGLLVRLAKGESSDPARRYTHALTHQQIADMIGTSRETVTRPRCNTPNVGHARTRS